MALEVRYVGHSYGCHPETCECNVYAITNERGKVISTHYREADAQKVLTEMGKDYEKRRYSAQADLDKLLKTIETTLEDAKKLANEFGLSFHYEDREFCSHEVLLRRIEEDYLDSYYSSSTNGAWLSSSDYC